MSLPNGHHTAPPLPREQELAAYRDMLLIRRFEEKAGQLYGMGLIGGFCHLYIGQEAVVVGMQMAIRQGDQVITTYRDHGHMLACGMDPKGVMAELTGRRGGYSKGKGGSMHMFSKEKNFYGGHGIVGANVPLGAGIAFANRYRGNGAVCLTYFGDGAANQGQVYESFNMAKLWKLPVVFVIENNKYAMGTSVERSAATTDFSQRGRSFDIPGEQVDGMDVRAVKATGERVVQWVREGNGPYILEMLTYRYRGHSMSDPGKYRTRDEIQKMREEHDPIEQVRRRLLEGKSVSEDELKKIDARGARRCQRLRRVRPVRSGAGRERAVDGRAGGSAVRRGQPPRAGVGRSVRDVEARGLTPSDTQEEREEMPTEILMPALSPTMEEGKLAKWLVAEGQDVKPGDVIAEIETDKATMEVEAVDEGKVVQAAGARGHRRREGQYADRAARWRGRCRGISLSPLAGRGSG